MIHKPSQAYLQAHFIVDSRFTGLRSTSAHGPDLRHVITLFPFTIPSCFPDIDIPLDNISGFSYAFSVDTDEAKHAIPIGATGTSRQ